VEWREGDGAVALSSPLVMSPSVSFVVLSAKRFSINCRATFRSPPETVLFLLNFDGGGGVGDGEGKA
jgi:hypothetical protein